MFIDARTLTDQTTVSAQLAIIGGGPAGITLAREMAQAGVDVCLVEAGGLDPDADSQRFYEGESSGIQYPLSGSRLRFLGGSSNHWGGFCRPLDPIDFEQRDWVPYSGWPFTIDELLPYYEKACDIVEIAPGRFDDDAYWTGQTGQAALQLQSGRMQIRYMHYSKPTRFGKRYREDLERDPHIRVLLNANVVDISASPDARAVTHLQVRTLNGLQLTIKAQHYVLATGGLENARMLLLSNKVMKNGLGNGHDLVGRFFMEHPHLSSFGEIVIADPARLPMIYKQRVMAEGREATAAFNPTPDFLRKKRLLNASFMMAVVSHYRHDSPGRNNTGKSITHIDMLKGARDFIAQPDRAQAQADDKLGAWLGLGCACEQLPNPDSRVTLSAERDAFGLPRIHLHWQLGEQERRSVLEHMRTLALEFGALDLGRMFISVDDDGRWPVEVRGGNHHMGTTRMHIDPHQGVVDQNCKVHGMANLHIAGSSVFPTSGASNPTLTLVALTLRLAQHLRSQLT